VTPEHENLEARCEAAGIRLPSAELSLLANAVAAHAQHLERLRAFARAEGMTKQ
jgi:hypothetical protein